MQLCYLWNLEAKYHSAWNSYKQQIHNLKKKKYKYSTYFGRGTKRNHVILQNPIQSVEEKLKLFEDFFFLLYLTRISNCVFSYYLAKKEYSFNVFLMHKTHTDHDVKTKSINQIMGKLNTCIQGVQCNKSICFA